MSQAQQGSRSPSPLPAGIIPKSRAPCNIEEIKAAWHFICPDGHDAMTKSQAYERLAELFPSQLSAREVKALIGQGNLSIDKLEDLLVRHEPPKDLDPAKEAFKLLDPQATGFVEINTIKQLLTQMPGIGGKLDQEDIDFLTQVCDADQDGRINFQDFLQIGDEVPSQEEQEAAIQEKVAQNFSILFGKGPPKV